ncbi:unnamed protein product [Rhodiola kirilowii]
MKAFLKSLDDLVWRAVEKGLAHPTTIGEDGKVTVLAEDKWNEVERNAAAGNYKAMNAIFLVVDGKNLKTISTCKIAEMAWDILQTAHEDKAKVKISRIKMVTSKFESLKMKEDKTIADFNTRVLDISNESFALGELMSKEKLVRKVLRSLPKQYSKKAIAAEWEAQDVRTMRLDELMGSLQTHEMEMEEEEQHKKVLKCLSEV